MAARKIVDAVLAKTSTEKTEGSASTEASVQPAKYLIGSPDQRWFYFGENQQGTMLFVQPRGDAHDFDSQTEALERLERVRKSDAFARVHTIAPIRTEPFTACPSLIVYTSRPKAALVPVAESVQGAK